MKFHFKADITFDADSIDDALILLSKYFTESEDILPNDSVLDFIGYIYVEKEHEIVT